MKISYLIILFVQFFKRIHCIFVWNKDIKIVNFSCCPECGRVNSLGDYPLELLHHPFPEFWTTCHCSTVEFTFGWSLKRENSSAVVGCVPRDFNSLSSLNVSLGTFFQPRKVGVLKDKESGSNFKVVSWIRHWLQSSGYIPVASVRVNKSIDTMTSQKLDVFSLFVSIVQLFTWYGWTPRCFFFYFRDVRERRVLKKLACDGIRSFYTLTPLVLSQRDPPPQASSRHDEPADEGTLQCQILKGKHHVQQRPRQQDLKVLPNVRWRQRTRQAELTQDKYLSRGRQKVNKNWGEINKYKQERAHAPARKVKTNKKRWQRWKSRSLLLSRQRPKGQ